MRVVDYIVRRLEDLGVEQAFLITGGGAMHLNDAFRRSTKIKLLHPHHEQAVSIACEGYTRASGKLSVGIITSGPGGTNTITGVIGQWLDSIPCIYLSGQVRYDTCSFAHPTLNLRQLGDQELDIVTVVKSITKYSTVLTDPNSVEKVLSEAIHAATSGRMGPVWIDIPLNIQGAIIDPGQLVPANVAHVTPVEGPSKNLTKSLKEFVQLLRSSKRPVIVAGHGIRLSDAVNEFHGILKFLDCPVVTTFNGIDVLPSNHPNFVGRIGTLGTRSGNFSIQNSDLYISIGSRNNIRQVSYFYEAYARSAKKVVIDIDHAELDKPTLSPDLKIHADAKAFLNALKDELLVAPIPKFSEWIEWCKERYHKYDPVLPEYYETAAVHPYVFIRELTKGLPENATLVAGNGTACVAAFQASVIKAGQRVFWNSGCASMGYDLPAAIGAAMATKQPVFCIAGDGSIMMNLQELVTLAHYKLPIRVIILNNNGYQSIRQTQKNFFGEPFVGCGPESGVGFPNFELLSKAIGLDYLSISTTAGLESGIRKILSYPERPVVCEIHCDRDYVFAPKLSSKKLASGAMVSSPLEDMAPFLSREEFLSNMIISPLEPGE